MYRLKNTAGYPPSLTLASLRKGLSRLVTPRTDERVIGTSSRVFMAQRKTNAKVSAGFALLLTMIVVAVTLAVGLSLLNITLKQFTLSSTSRDSEIAFHAADSGLE